MSWIYLSPHFDDAAYSCGALIWEQAQCGDDPQIWTIFSGSPPKETGLTPFALSLHERWQLPLDQAVEHRRRENQAALSSLGAVGHELGIPECIYRRTADGMPVISAEEDLWQEIPPGEASLVALLGDLLANQTPDGANLVSPLSLGNHVDHRIVRAAAERAVPQLRNINLWYYADFPYVMRGHGLLPPEGFEEITFPVSEQGLVAWQGAVAAYPSQFSSFWHSNEEMQAEIRQYCQSMGGLQLFRKVEQS